MLQEDCDAVIDAARLGLAEVWIGEHFTTKVEMIPAPFMLFARVLDRAKNIRFGTGVINLPHLNPVVVAAEAAMLDQMSGGRVMLGVGPGGPTAAYIAEHDFILISANFIPLENAEAQWSAYSAARETAGKPADPAIWRVARNILVTETKGEARDQLSNLDGTLAY